MTSITCQVCNYEENPEGVQFCEACGSDLTPPEIQPVSLSIEPSISLDMHQANRAHLAHNSLSQPLAATTSPSDPPIISYPPIPAPNPNIPNSSRQPDLQPQIIQQSQSYSSSQSLRCAKLVLIRPADIKPDSFVSQEYFIDRKKMLIGCFDPETGPVDINLEKIHQSEQVSRKHGQLIWDGNSWVIQDIGSTNGIFIRFNGQDTWNNRITEPTHINDGDEIAIGPICFRFELQST